MKAKKILGLGLVGLLGLSLVACNDSKPVEPEIPDQPGKPTEPEKPNQPEIPEDKPNETVRYRNDEREESYILYGADNVEFGRYKSLYQAIEVSIQEADRGSYVVADGKDKRKLFENIDGFAADSKDMFWYYSDTNRLAGYNNWIPTYAKDLEGTDYITVMNEHAGAGAAYMNGIEYVGLGEGVEATTPVWNTQWYVESSATVDLEAYSGITKEVYELELSKAEIAPVYQNEVGTETYAYVGFITADGNYIFHMGLACETTTGNWYYYTGESSANAGPNIEIHKDQCVLTSTWNDTKKCYIPNSDVTLSLETLMLEKGTDNEHYVNRLDAKFTNGKEVRFDFEDGRLTQCGTIRFTAALDIIGDNSVKDYMNGSYFNNLIVKSAKGYAFEEVLADYGALPTLEAGEYNLLNSSEVNPARYKTMIYTPSCTSYEFNGVDTYNFSFTKETQTENVYSDSLDSVYDLIQALPSDNLTAEVVNPASTAFNSLKKYEKHVFDKINQDVYKKLMDALEAIK